MRCKVFVDVYGDDLLPGGAQARGQWKRKRLCRLTK